jgi:hypothetical protein
MLRQGSGLTPPLLCTLQRANLSRLVNQRLEVKRLRNCGTDAVRSGQKGWGGDEVDDYFACDSSANISILLKLGHFYFAQTGHSHFAATLDLSSFGSYA